jgi:hypothetical protein
MIVLAVGMTTGVMLIEHTMFGFQQTQQSSERKLWSLTQEQ